VIHELARITRIYPDSARLGVADETSSEITEMIPRVSQSRLSRGSDPPPLPEAHVDACHIFGDRSIPANLIVDAFDLDVQVGSFDIRVASVPWFVLNCFLISSSGWQRKERNGCSVRCLTSQTSSFCRSHCRVPVCGNETVVRGSFRNF